MSSSIVQIDFTSAPDAFKIGYETGMLGEHLMSFLCEVFSWLALLTLMLAHTLTN
ncbi:hypothetical protein [Arthrobacter sp. MYb227]|uniref:hypothetical protein n=1 Tax=Arthrobacter sp. MYb227 TaxID=1848601 RepID=UPI0015E3A66A|nr:hypothetical protein [Arthrobacter sp. MYb227]